MSLGAFITVVALAIGPFSQQVVHYIDRNVVLKDINATVPRSNIFNRSGIFQVYGVHANMDLSLKAAVYDALYNINSPSLAITTHCPTGNCTFPANHTASYSSIGVCSKCDDITDLIELSSTSYDTTALEYSWSLPNGQELKNAFQEGHFMVSNSTSAYRDKTTLQGIGASFANLSMLSLVGRNCTIGSSVADSTCPDSWLTAWAGECAMYFCVKSYSASIAAGVLTEDVVSTYINNNSLDITQESYVMVPDTCLIDGQSYNISEYATTQNHTNDPRYVALSDNGTLFWLWSACVYQVDTTAVISMLDYFGTAFDGFTDGDDLIRVSYSADIMQVLYASGNASLQTLDSTFTQLANTMTNNMRLNGYGDLAVGLTWQTTTYIHVEYGWLSLPAALVGLSILFLVATMIRSRKLAVWKSSALAVVYHGIREEWRVEADTLKQMNKAADKTKVVLTGVKNVEMQVI